MNSAVILIGNIVQDMDLRYTTTGRPQLTFGVAVDRTWENRSTREMEKHTSFFDVVCWGELAENVAQNVGKGDLVVVSGHLEQRSWQAQDGSKRYKVEVYAADVGPSLRFPGRKPQQAPRASTLQRLPVRPNPADYVDDETPF